MPIEKSQVVLFHYSVTVTPEKAYGQGKTGTDLFSGPS
tara:strand:- start:73 stop:186 length:114 start_codon:yes stop_codon:yes gene_type:complete